MLRLLEFIGKVLEKWKLHRKEGSKSLHRDPCLFGCIFNSMSGQGTCLEAEQENHSWGQSMYQESVNSTTLVHTGLGNLQIETNQSRDMSQNT